MNFFFVLVILPERFYMKLKTSLLKKLIEKKVSASELSLLLYCVQRQDNDGLVLGVHYKDYCNDADLCEQSFYNALKGLKDKHIISYTHNSQLKDYDIHIEDHSFPTNFKKYKDKTGQFIKMDASIFSSDSFAVLSANEKLIALDIYRQLVASPLHIKKFTLNGFIKTYSEMFSLSKRTILLYKTHLANVFRFKLKGGSLIVSFINGIENASAKTCSNVAMYKRLYTAKVLFRRARIKEAHKELLDGVAEMLLQYKGKILSLEDALLNSIHSALQYCKKNSSTISINLINHIFNADYLKNNNVPERKNLDYEKNPFNRMMKTTYDFEQLEKEILANI